MKRRMRRTVAPNLSLHVFSLAVFLRISCKNYTRLAEGHFRSYLPRISSIGIITPNARKISWTTFGVLGLAADLALPFWWALGATIPLGVLSWWVAYRSDWF